MQVCAATAGSAGRGGDEIALDTTYNRLSAADKGIAWVTITAVETEPADEANSAGSYAIDGVKTYVPWVNVSYLRDGVETNERLNGNQILRRRATVDSSPFIARAWKALSKKQRETVVTPA